MKKKRTSVVPKKGKAIWTDDNLRLLGTMSDTELAAQMGVCKTTISLKRNALQIPPFGKSRDQTKHKWTAKELSWLGKLCDTEVGRRVGLDPTTVGAKRQSLGISLTKNVHPGRKTRVWTKQQLAQLGKMNDVQYSKKFGIARRFVKQKRYELGIPAFDMYNGITPWNPKWDKELGKKTDVQIAKERNVSSTRVKNRRTKLGIPPYYSSRVKFRWTSAILLQLKQLGDEAFAKTHQLDIRVVSRKRSELVAKGKWN